MAGNEDTRTHWPTRVLRSGDRRSLSRSATRALDVLEFFGQVRRPLRAVEIARRFSLHPSTVNQLLKTMVESAHLTFEALTKTYLPSPRLAYFSSWMVATYGNDERLRKLLAEVRATSNEVVTLTTPKDLVMQVIDFAGSGVELKADSSSAERGLRVSIFGSAIGLAYLSSLPQPEIRRLAERARISSSDQDSLMKMVAKARIDGFAEGPSGQGRFWSLALALPRDAFNVPLVIGLAGPAKRIKPRIATLVSALQSGVAGFADKYTSGTGGHSIVDRLQCNP